jgi:hypothetical protein
MQTGRLLIVVAVLAMLAMDFVLLKQPASSAIVQPETRPRREVKVNKASPRMNTPDTNVLEALPASPDPVQVTQTTLPPQTIAKPEKAVSSVAPEPFMADPLNLFQTSYAWMEPIQDPVARVALRYVGIDPDAEDYWDEAINDPTLSDEERKDLIEDLNEEGFPDPDNLTLDDLPLIVSRILIIEQLGPDAMDQANADAFTEAYKDLVNMYYSLVFEEEEENANP